MKIFLFLYSLILCSLMNASHPLVLSLMLIITAMMVGAFLFFNLSLWAMNTIILIFLGGMMILFLYISTLSNNEKLLMSSNNLFILLGLILYLFMGPFSSGSSSYSLMSDKMMDFSTLFKHSHMGGLMFLVLYLLVTLFSVVKMSENFKGALMKVV